jgi:very-short-patch-repair endonuclease
VSDLERAFAFQVKAHGLPEPEREYRFLPPRRWRFDFAWPDARVAVEVEGGAFVQGRHTRGIHFERDAEKYSRAAIEGWCVIRATGNHVDSGEAILWLKEALERAKERV